MEGLNATHSIPDQGRRKVSNFGGALIKLDLRSAENIEEAHVLFAQNIGEGGHVPLCPPVPTPLQVVFLRVTIQFVSTLVVRKVLFCKKITVLRG